MREIKLRHGQETEMPVYAPERSDAVLLILTKVRPASDIKALPSHTTVKATTGRKEQFKTVAHPAAHAEEGLSSKKRGRR
jgi:hypothetical protein